MHGCTLQVVQLIECLCNGGSTQHDAMIGMQHYVLTSSHYSCKPTPLFLAMHQAIVCLIAYPLIKSQTVLMRHLNPPTLSASQSCSIRHVGVEDGIVGRVYLVER